MDANQIPMTPAQFNELVQFTKSMKGFHFRPGSKSWQFVSSQLSVIEACQLMCLMNLRVRAQRLENKFSEPDAPAMNFRDELQIESELAEYVAQEVLLKIAYENLDADLNYARSLNEYLRDDQLALAIDRSRIQKDNSNAGSAWRQGQKALLKQASDFFDDGKRIIKSRNDFYKKFSTHLKDPNGNCRKPSYAKKMIEALISKNVCFLNSEELVMHQRLAQKLVSLPE